MVASSQFWQASKRAPLILSYRSRELLQINFESGRKWQSSPQKITEKAQFCPRPVGFDGESGKGGLANEQEARKQEMVQQ